MQENLSMSVKMKEARRYNVDTHIHTDTRVHSQAAVRCFWTGAFFPGGPEKDSKKEKQRGEFPKQLQYFVILFSPNLIPSSLI